MPAEGLVSALLAAIGAVGCALRPRHAVKRSRRWRLFRCGFACGRRVGATTRPRTISADRKNVERSAPILRRHAGPFGSATRPSVGMVLAERVDAIPT